MSTIVYACVNEGVRKLIEHPARAGPLIAPADALQTVLMTVPLGEARQQEVEDDDYTYFYRSNGRHLVGCACRRLPGRPTPEKVTRDVHAFLKDAIALVPAQAASAALSVSALVEMQRLLKARLEASTDQQISDINAAIERGRAAMVDVIEAAMAREEAARRLEASSAAVASTADVLKRNAAKMEWTFLGQRFKTLAMLGGAVAVVIIIIVFMVCDPNLSACRSAAPPPAPITTTTRAPATTRPVAPTTRPPPFRS